MGPKNPTDNTGKRFEELIDDLYWKDPPEEPPEEGQQDEDEDD